MYVNPHFAETELSTLHDVIEENPFGLLVAPGAPPIAAHIPFVLHAGDGPYGTLVAHTARADPLSAALDDAGELLVVFQGPSAYVRSRWYVNTGLPTYNFIAVHAYGSPRPLGGREAVLSHLSELVSRHEARYDDEFRLAEADAAYLEPLLEHISPFSLEIKRIEGKVKLNQNRAADDRSGVIRGLRQRGSADDRAVADAMERYAYRSDQAQPLLPAASQANSDPLADRTRQPAPKG